MNSRRKPYESGFTLVELMMSIFVSSIVLLASGSMMALITGQWERGMDRVELAAETALTFEPGNELFKERLSDARERLEASR